MRRSFEQAKICDVHGCPNRERNAGVYVTRKTTFRTRLLLARITQLAATKPLPCAFIFIFLSFSYPTQYFAVTREKKKNSVYLYV